MKIRGLTAIVPVLLLALTPGNGEKVEYYHSLRFLNTADAPRNVAMIRSDNANRAGNQLAHGVLFTYKNRMTRNVAIAGSFNDWKPTAMKRSKNGVWYYFLDQFENDKELSYKYQVDGVWTDDPENQERADDGMGSYVSVTRPPLVTEGHQVTYRRVDRGIIEFRIWNEQARFISLVGDFNHWNPENDLLTRGKDGIWRLRKRLSPGQYRYQYVIDGRWAPDTFNSQSSTSKSGELCSKLVIE